MTALSRGATLVKFVRTYAVLFGIVGLGAALRIGWNDVASYAPADEAYYVSAAQFLEREGLSAYPRLVAAHLERADLAASPTPLRWGYFVLTTLACAVDAPCDGRTLAWLSTIAGIVSIVFTYLLGARLVGPRAGLVAAALTVTSPLQLALSRRALQDEVYCAVFLAASWALVRLAQDKRESLRARWRPMALFAGLATLAFAVKEAFVFPYAALAAATVLALRSRLRPADVLLFLVPPALFFVGFLLLGRDASAFFELVRLARASFLDDYGIQYQSGPPHRPLFDLFVLAPIVCILGIVALARLAERPRENRGALWLACFLLVSLAAFVGLPKNLRFLVVLDPILRLLAAWAIVSFPWAGRARGAGFAAALLLPSAVFELALFHETFITFRTYDPTTYDVLRALGALPGPAARAGSSAFPFVFFAALGVLLVGLVIRRKVAVSETPTNEETTDEEAAEKTAEKPAARALKPAGGSGVVAFWLGAIVVAFLSIVIAWKASSPIPAGKPGGVGLPGAALNPRAAPPRSPNAPADPMTLGLDALYTRSDPVLAAARFREVLAENPDHYGATYQLATALEQAGDPRGARPLWEKMATMADGIGDTQTAEHARARMAAIDERQNGLALADPTASMQLGLDALYNRKNPEAAAAHFRAVLAHHPDHYGATFQLATALDQAGRPAEARPLWTKMLGMAEGIGDTKTAEAVRARLAKNP
ncbi:tetratricopeptide repeat protein [Polyangium jinanense]|uniref:Tetratricopeptide repeat protein n=1 Tax=Polyangium jinanense TaxID=2829994 RepID=A0A9X3X4K2_9BACT|nr:tetratricopeptide repeat protein [Polyangium jinanense]MDC3954919.1 tetratricopeptide repeat protein [Polyangium jinanense]MDC3981311.1 tetratricopeptide repeat protein [Polyangium jinanense]